MIKQVLFVFIGGGVGSVSRFLIGKAMEKYASIFPLGTFTSNVIACLVFGVVSGFLFQKFGNESSLKPLILIGFCGGLSTFSSFSAEIYQFVKTDNYGMLALYLSASVVCCFASFLLTAQFVKS